jgi:hypothetical protein
MAVRWSGALLDAVVLRLLAPSADDRSFDRRQATPRIDVQRCGGAQDDIFLISEEADQERFETQGEPASQ